jgi:sarcosine oxidase subunit alpha
MLSSAVKKYADYYGVICGKKNIFLQIMIVLMKVQFHYTKKGIKVQAIIDIREKSKSSIVKEAKNLVLKFIGHIQLLIPWL